MTHNEVKQLIFKRVYDRLLSRKESLELFRKHWVGKSPGIEGWFKVEFVAAIAPAVAEVKTGGATRRGHDEKKSSYPDLVLLPPGGSPIPVELKGGIEGWYFGGGKDTVCKKYGGCLLAFLASSDERSFPKHEKKARAVDVEAQLEPICDVQTRKGQRTIYLGMLDLCDEASN